MREQLEKILASEAFARADRMSRFLRFIVQETVKGKGAQLKEYLIGVEVFDRDKLLRSSHRSGSARRSQALAHKAHGVLRARGERRPRPHSSSQRKLCRCLSGVLCPIAPIETKLQLSVKSAPAGAKSIAVLPFLNLSPNPENEYFSDGLTEEIIHALGKVNGMSVVARTSVFQYKGRAYDIRQIGEQLWVQTVLEGSVRTLR